MSGAVVEDGSSAAAVGFPKRPTKEEDQGGRTEVGSPWSILTSSLMVRLPYFQTVDARRPCTHLEA